MLSIVILTKNEERDLQSCLDSVAWSDDVVVFDSHSTDRTADIALSFGARVIGRKFDNYAAQRNASLHEVSYKNAWILILDADETVPLQLQEELLDFATNAAPDISAGRIRRRDYFMGTWLKHSQLSPYFVRVVRPEFVRYEREVNEVLRVDGAIHDLASHFNHYPFSKGIEHWVAKHNTYSTMEAQLILRERADEVRLSVSRACFSRDFNERRVHQKRLFYRLPLRPLLKFVLTYFARLGFLDGRAGLKYAILQAIYEYLIVLKTTELASQPLRRSSLPRDDAPRSAVP